MKESQAIEEGLSFTGWYKQIKSETVEEAKRIRKLGFKAKVVTVYASRYARGQNTGITGWSVYACKKYFADKSLKELIQRKAAIPSLLTKAKEDYDKAVQKINDSSLKMDMRIAESKLILNQ